MAEDPKQDAAQQPPQQKMQFGQGGVRRQSMEELRRKKQIIEEQKRKALMREQIVFFCVMTVSITPIIIAFMSKDDQLAFLLFKIGGSMLLVLYPGYLLIRFFIALAQKKEKGKDV